MGRTGWPVGRVGECVEWAGESGDPILSLAGWVRMCWTIVLAVDGKKTGVGSGQGMGLAPAPPWPDSAPAGRLSHGTPKSLDPSPGPTSHCPGLAPSPWPDPRYGSGANNGPKWWLGRESAKFGPQHVSIVLLAPQRGR